MNRSEPPSLQDIRNSHSPKAEYERYLFVSRYLFRPPAFAATWLLVRLGVSSETASWLSGLAALCGFVFLLWPGAPLLWPGIAMLLLFNLFDCLDGGIARVMNTRNPYGRFLDSIMSWADMSFWIVLGIVVWRVPGLRRLGDAVGAPPAVWLAAGGLSALLSTYAAYLESVFDLLLRGHWETLMRREGTAPAPTPIAGKSGPEVFVRVLLHNLRVRETHYVLLAACFFFGIADIMLAFFLAVNAVLVASLLFEYCGRGRKIYAAGLGREQAR